MGFFQQLGKVLGITGKPVSWMPGVILAVGQDPTAAKEAVELQLRQLVMPQIAVARQIALKNLERYDPEKAINQAFDALEVKMTKLQL
jgi:hypothetical protein